MTIKILDILKVLLTFLLPALFFILPPAVFAAAQSVWASHTLSAADNTLTFAQVSPLRCHSSIVCVCVLQEKQKERAALLCVSSLAWSGLSECESDFSWLSPSWLGVDVAGLTIGVFSDLLSDLLSTPTPLSPHRMGFLFSAGSKGWNQTADSTFSVGLHCFVNPPGT